MPKNRLQDIKRVTRSPVKKVVPRVEGPDSFISSRKVERTQVSFTNRKKEKRGRGKFRLSLWILATASVIFLFFAVSFIFSKAVVTINPKVKDISLNNSFSADKDTSSQGLVFNLVVIGGEEKKAIPSTTTKAVTASATGVVTLYNAFSTSSMTLAINTQLDGSNGKIYKTVKRITIPAMSKTGTPGKVEVGVVASSPGEEFNSEPLDFKVTNFKGTNKYDKIYGRSQNDITGGLKGTFPVIGEEEKVATLDSLKSNLNDKLIQKATDQIPEGFILFKDAVFLTTKDANLVPETNSSTVPVGLTGTLYGFLLDEASLTKKIAGSTMSDYDGSDVFIPNIRDLKFSLADKENVSFSDVKNIRFNLSGNIKVVWRFDTKQFINDVIGEPKTIFSQVLAKYPNINSADLVIEPFWRSSFPEKKESILINVNYPN